MAWRVRRENYSGSRSGRAPSANLSAILVGRNGCFALGGLKIKTAIAIYCA
jgi:hypothetical protein